MSFTPVAAAVVFPVAAACSLAGSAVLVSRLERLSARLGLSEAMLGLIVALAADSPEITSAISASAHGQAGVGSGVVLGSNVFNLAALLGLGALVAGRISMHRKVVILDGSTGTWVAMATLLAVASGLGAAGGLVLVLAAVVPYVVISAVSPHGLGRLGVPARVVSWLQTAIAEEEQELSGLVSRTRGHVDVGIVVASLGVVVVASVFMERSAAALGARYHLSDLIVGGVVLAGVTSLPNAVGAVFLAWRGRGAAVLSEAMNSNMLNIVVGLFLPGLFVGLHGSAGDGVLVATWYAALTLFSLAAAYAGHGLGRRAGAAIVAGYLSFLAVAVVR